MVRLPARRSGHLALPWEAERLFYSQLRRPGIVGGNHRKLYVRDIRSSIGCMQDLYRDEVSLTIITEDYPWPGFIAFLLGHISLHPSLPAYVGSPGGARSLATAIDAFATESEKSEVPKHLAPPPA